MLRRKNRLFYFSCFWFRFFIYSLVRELFLSNTYKMIFLDFTVNYILCLFMHLKTSKEHLKLFIYFENKIFPSDTLIIQETHSAKEDDIK